MGDATTKKIEHEVSYGCGFEELCEV